MTEYDLPEIVSVSGTFTIKIFSSDATLTEPVVDTVLDIGDLVESVDTAIGFVELSTLKLKIRDDYSTHTMGFWYKLLAADTTQIRIYLDEGSGDTFYFFGIPQQEAIVWTEHSLFNGGYIRTADITLVSMGAVLFDTAVADWALEVAGDGLGTDFGNMIDSSERNDLHPTYYISLMGAFSSMLVTSGLNATYSAGDTTFVYGSQDLRFGETSSAIWRVDELYLCGYYWDGVGMQHVLTEYWGGNLGGGEITLASRFSTLRELLTALLPNLGVALKMDYDVGTERHKIKLIQRGRAYADGAKLDFDDKEKRSEIRKAYELLADSIQVTFLPDPSTPTNVFYSKRYYGLTGQQDQEAPDYINFDFDLQCIFRCNDGGGGFSFGDGPPAIKLSRFFYALVSGELEPITEMQYWNYLISDYGTATGNEMEDAMASYLFYRFTNVFSSIIRSYGLFAVSNGSTTTHANASILQRTDIDDGNGSATYYANRVTKSPVKNEIEVEWILES